jgi:prophage regulatory protein
MTTIKIDKKVVNLQEILTMLGISKSTLYRSIASGNFPKPFKLGERLNAWRVETIEAWLNAQSANVEGGI